MLRAVNQRIAMRLSVSNGRYGNCFVWLTSISIVLAHCAAITAPEKRSMTWMVCSR